MQIYGIRTKDCAFGHKSCHEPDFSLMRNENCAAITFGAVPPDVTRTKWIGETALFLGLFAVRDVAFWSE